MARYYRFQAYAVRTILAVWWLLAVLIPMSWWLNGDPFPRYWWALHLAGVPLTALFWGVSGHMLKIAERN